MSSAVFFLAFSLQLSVSQALTCVSPYSNIIGVCLHFPTQRTTWCGAQDYCLSVGGELVQGTSYLPLAGQTFSGMPDRYWIGLTDLLHERRSNSTGWRWSNGDVSPPSSGLQWASNEPGYSPGTHDCVYQCHGSGKLCDMKCVPDPGYDGVPMCQPRPKSNSNTRVRDFAVGNIPVGLPNEEYAQGECSKLVTNVGNALKCARICATDHEDCVSFYFHKAREECRLVFYTDATVTMGDANGWKKFVVKK